MEQPRTSAKIEVYTLPSWHVAYKRLRTTWGGAFNGKVMAAFDEVARWCQRRYTADDIGISILCSAEDNWQRLPDALTYDACVVVPRLVQHEQQEIKTQHLPGGLYAVCRIEKQAGAPSAFAEAIREMTWMSEYMYIHWIPNHGYQLDDKPGMHIFYTEPANETIAMSCCLPISPIMEQDSQI
ncbi:Bacterial transcription activator, effector binding domain [compost metagenome]